MRRPLLALFALFISAAAHAQLSANDPVPKKPLVTLTARIASHSGDEVHGTINATIEPTWHINSYKPLDEFLIPTVLSFDPASADLVKADYPPHVIHSFAFSGDQKLAVYEGTIAIPFVAKLKNGATSMHAVLRYQACNDSVCLPPNKAEMDISVSATASSSPPKGTGFTALAQAPKNYGDNKLAQTFATHGLPLALVVLFVGGLALNLTPCVLPMVPITIGFFSLQSDGRRSRRFLLSLAYVLGIVVMYATLGVVASLSGALFGAWLQHKAVLVGLAVLMAVFASSMFGAWEMTVPQFIANRSGGRAGYLGAAVMGLFVGIVAAPCVGPVVAALFFLVASIGKASIGFAMFATLGFGLGFPYLVALSILPKPGEWMVQFKKALGFVLVAEVFYFLRPLTGETIFRAGVAASLIFGAIFLFFIRTGGARALRYTFAVLLLIASIPWAMPQHTAAQAGGGKWQKYEASTIKASTGKPVIVDFYADWCIPCKELDEKTFSDPAVASELDRFTRIKANLTDDQNPEVQRLTKEYNIVGVPTLVFIDSTGHEVAAQRLTGFEQPKAFLARLQQVK